MSARRYLRSEDHIAFAVEERVAWITLNRPEKRNALSDAMLRELHEALLESDALLEVNAIVLGGAGRDFCAGYDLAASYEDGSGGDDEPLYRSRNDTMDDDCWNLEVTHRLTSIIPQLHKPVVAKVHGNCLAGGTDVAFMCDMVLAADNARIGFPATRANGSPPSNMWLYHCGPQWAKRLLMTGDCVSGQDAARLGLVLDAVPEDELDAEVAELARRLSLVDPELLSAQKRIVNLGMELLGAQTLQRLALEMDARAHLSRGPRRARFREDMANAGLKRALANRDAPFGDGMVRLRSTGC